MSLPPNISTVLFDVGNTLNHLDYAFIAEVISRHSHAVDRDEVALAEYAAKASIDALFRARLGGDDGVRRLSYFEVILDTLGVPTHAAEPILADMRAEEARASLWRVMHDDTPGVIAALRRRGFALAVVSNADGRVAAGLRARGIADHFATIVDSFVVGVEKPDPRIFHFALEACGSKPEDAIYVGDIYEIDVRGARNAGITPVLLDPLERYGPVDCTRIDSLARLLDLLPATAPRR